VSDQSYSPSSTGSIEKIDQEISDLQDDLWSLPRSSHLRIPLLSHLAVKRLNRFTLSDEEQDLESSILQTTHAILLPFPPSIEGGLGLISTFFLLTEALFWRSHKYREPSDIRYRIKYLHYLRDQSLEDRNVTRNEVTASLVGALAHQVVMEPGNKMQTIEEISVLCRDLLSSDFSTGKPNLTDVIQRFAEAVCAYLRDSLGHLPQQVIECLREANRRLPDIDDVSFALFYHFSHRFDVTQSNEDYEHAMTLLDKIIASHSPADSPTENLKHSLTQAAHLAYLRFVFYGNPEYLEEAIVRKRAHLGSISLEDPERGDIIQSLVDLERTRFDEFDISNGLPDAHLSNPKVVDLPSFSQLAASLAESSAVKSPPMTLEDRTRHLEATQTMVRITNTADIEEGVKYCRLLLTSLQQCPNDMVFMTHMTHFFLGTFLHHAFTLINNPVYLNESIDVYRGILKLLVPSAQWFHFSVIQQLISSLESRYELFEDTKDFDEIMKLFPIAATNTFAKSHNRFWASCRWARFSRAYRHPSARAAYKTAITLMQDILTFAPTLEIQHHRLIAMGDVFHKLPLESASYQVQIGQFKEAIETLERGRGLLWSEMRGLRTSVDHLYMVDSRLAEKFTDVNRDLEALMTSGSLTLWSNKNKGDLDTSEEMDPFGRIVVKQQKLSNERAGLITEIRSLPGFEIFLRAPSFDALRSAAAAQGPVIIINHCEWRSDIIILLHNSPPSLIHINNISYNRAQGLKDRLLATRKEGLDSTEYEEALEFVLETLYDLVGRPVIQRLKELNIPEQSRIWWCPTSVFCSLPLHAMGPIRSEGPVKVYFSDLYISSYTPTLSALIESRKPGPHSFEKPSILLVSQPDESMPGAWEEMALVRHLNTKVTTLLSKKATPSAVMKRLEDHRFAHFSCHGILETGKPFDACFKLYQGERLTLLEIIRSRLPSAEFAFLSACHTAELTEESIADEGLHLSAAVQYSGFRSVVGTMWAMADIDGQFLAKNFYESLFSERWKDVPYYERTAEALRDAVKELRRKKRVTMERWVNFVHYGA
jgi:CHAT domain-containing protein